MTLTKNRIFFSILAFLLVINLLAIFNFDCLSLRAILSFVFLMTVPGLLIMLMLGIRRIGGWEYSVYVIGLSVAFMIFAGLFVNWTLPLFGIDKPLSLIFLLATFDILLLIFWLIAYRTNESISLEIEPAKLDWANRVFFIIPMVFPVLSILGALILNNSGPNHLTMTMLGGIAAYIFLLVPFRNKMNKSVYPFAILMISIALLLMFSLRSWHIHAAGDLGMEYYVFQLAKENSHWSMSSFRGGYNACLSLTILPTTLSWFLKTNDEYIFKLFFQLIFLVTPIGVYLFVRRYTKDIFAFATTFFFTSGIWFMELMTHLARQEIALLFFTLTLLILFSDNISPPLRKTLFLVFGFSMVVSHYSTTYLAVGLFIFTYLLCFIFRKTQNKNPFSKIYEKINLKKDGRKSNGRNYYLSGTLVLLLVIFTFLWHWQLTGSSGNLVDLAHETAANMGKMFSKDLRGERTSLVEQFNVFYEPKHLALLLENYEEEITLEYKKKPRMNLYSPDKYDDYKPRVTPTRVVPLRTSPGIASKIYLSMEVVKKLTYIFIVIGVFYLLFNPLKDLKVNMEYVIMTLGCILIVAAMSVLPVVSLRYPLQRAYQQTLVILSFPALLGGLVLFKFLEEYVRLILVLVMFTLYFLFYSGFIPQIVGGSDAGMQLNNYGRMYDSLYTHEGEVRSIGWLSDNYDKRDVTYVDSSARRKLLAFGKINEGIFEGVLPPIIDQNAYVYSSYANTIVGDVCQLYRGTYLYYNFPIRFLSENKDIIYNNRDSQIFQ